MEPAATIEHIPFIWGVAFVIDVIVGVLAFLVVVRRNVPGWSKGVMSWIGWWSWASALSLVINTIEGADAPFAYHQIGIFTETMTNIGLVMWGVSYLFKNWYVREDDWIEMEKLRATITHRNQLEEFNRDPE